MAVAHRWAGFDTNMAAVDALFRHCLDAASPAPEDFALTTLRGGDAGRSA